MYAVSNKKNAAHRAGLKPVPPRRTRWLAGLLLTAALPLTGCFTVRNVNKTVIAPHLMDSTVEQLIARMNTSYGAIQTMNASVDIATTTGGTHSGKVTENPTLAGYIILRKPSDLRVLMLAPVIRSRAIDMVSDGTNFKLFFSVFGHTKAIAGSDKITTPSKNGLENLRPTIIREALQIPAVGPDEFIDLTQDSRIITPAHGKQEAVEEPDYDVAFLHTRGDHILERVRVIHISRSTLLPYKQDIYSGGKLVTTVEYNKYQKFGDIDYPTDIFISRPIDEYTLRISINKLVLNQKVDDEQFVLNFPEGVVVQKM